MTTAKQPAKESASFTVHFSYPHHPILDFATWDISPDGKRLLMMKDAGSPDCLEGGSGHVNVVLNWSEELK